MGGGRAAVRWCAVSGQEGRGGVGSNFVSGGLVLSRAVEGASGGGWGAGLWAKLCGGGGEM